MTTLLNGTAGVAVIQHAFSAWEFDVTEVLQEFRRKRICSAWQVDHFVVLNRVNLIHGGATGNPQLDGMMSDKAQRLKDIARDLDIRAQALWPFRIL